jgi:hypothetical protein
MAYQALIGHKSDLAVASQSGQGPVKNYASQIQSALQDAMGRSAAPGDMEAYSNARLQYKNMMTVAPLVNKGVPGDISPLLLQGAANRSFKSNAFRGAGDLGELGDIGQSYLKAPPDSGTATRSLFNGSIYAPAIAAGRLGAGFAANRLIGGVMNQSPIPQPFAYPSMGALLPQNRLAPPDKN